MNEVIERLINLVYEVPAKLNSLTEEELSKRGMPNKWSKKEILGHLCDSAAFTQIFSG